MEIVNVFNYGHLKGLLDSISYAILVEDPNRKIAFVNKQFFDLFGIPTEYHNLLIGTNCIDSALKAKDLFVDSSKFFQDIQDIPRQKNDRTDKLLTVDGRVLKRTFKALNYIHDNSPSTYCVWTYEDVTSIELYKNNLQNVIAKEKELNELRSQFLRITSHELRTPLTVILTSADLSNATIDNPSNIDSNALADYNNLIIEQVEEMSDILDTLLVVENIDNKKIKQEIRRVDIFEYSNTILKNRFMPYKDGRFLKLFINTKERFCTIDIKLYKYALINLVDNAFKYSMGSIEPTVELKVNGSVLNVIVTDFGIGIPENDQNNIFESFYRGDNVTGVPGTGVGLMVAKYAVEYNGGMLKLIESRNGKTIFNMIINAYGTSS